MENPSYGGKDGLENPSYGGKDGLENPSYGGEKCGLQNSKISELKISDNQIVDKNAGFEQNKGGMVPGDGTRGSRPHPEISGGVLFGVVNLRLAGRIAASSLPCLL